MAYQLSGLMVQTEVTDEPKEILEKMGFPDGIRAGTVPFIEATSPQQFSRMVGTSGDWTMVTDAMPFVHYNRTAPVGSLWAAEVAQFMIDSSRGGTRAFGFIMSRLSSNYGFSLYEDGKHVRSMLMQMGNELVSEGDRLAEETEELRSGNQELALFHLMEALEIPFHSFENTRFHYFAFERIDE